MKDKTHKYRFNRNTLTLYKKFLTEDNNLLLLLLSLVLLNSIRDPDRSYQQVQHMTYSVYSMYKPLISLRPLVIDFPTVEKYSVYIGKRGDQPFQSTTKGDLL